jgi:CDP-diacylglycerol--serine O-phosphatidyltransferase
MPNKARQSKAKVKYIAVLPSFITLMNALCGFMAIVYSGYARPVALFFRHASVPALSFAGFMIFAAMIADMLDGWFARLTDTASEFGAHLDSLADAVSFGAAPAFLLLKIEEAPLNAFRAEAGTNLAALLGRGVTIIALIYLSCAVIRLARFNSEAPAPTARRKASHDDFAGLPSPAAAGLVAGLVTFRESFLPKIAAHAPGFCSAASAAVIAALPFVTLAASFLMVSRIRYPHPASAMMRMRKTVPFFALIFLILLLAVFHIHIALLLGFAGYTLTGVLYAPCAALKKRLSKPGNPRSGL